MQNLWCHHGKWSNLIECCQVVDTDGTWFGFFTTSESESESESEYKWKKMDQDGFPNQSYITQTWSVSTQALHC